MGNISSDKREATPCNATYECTENTDCRDDANNVNDELGKDEVLCRCINNYIPIEGLCVGKTILISNNQCNILYTTCTHL